MGEPLNVITGKYPEKGLMLNVMNRIDRWFQLFLPRAYASVKTIPHEPLNTGRDLTACISFPRIFPTTTHTGTRLCESRRSGGAEDLLLVDLGDTVGQRE